jgi:hypothetical protein
MIVVAGATGNLGGRIVCELRKRDIPVRALVRPDTSPERLTSLKEQAVEVVEVNLDSRPEAVEACKGASCVVSALLGLHEVMIETQSNLAEAAVGAGVPRFIPSDYAMDFTKVAPGLNRNLDLHRDFQEKLNHLPIRSTSVLNGAFTELLMGDAPIVLAKIKRVLYWGDPEQLLDFTSMDNTAAFTAEAALDPSTPRFLRVAGEQVSAIDLAKAATDLGRGKFSVLRGGNLNRLKHIIRITRAFTPASDNPFPVWQGMQYLHCMFEGSGKLSPLDNGRYPNLRWTGVKEILKQIL